MSALTNFFDEARVIQRTPIIEQKSIYGLSNLRDIWSGDVTSNGTEFIIRAAAGGAQNAVLDTAERGPYPPGYELEPGFAVRVADKPVGGQGAEWGYFDDFDGWFYRLTATGLYTVRRRAGADVATQLVGTWDGDTIRASGFPRKFTFKPSDGYMYEIPFSWYGFGPAEFKMQLKALQVAKKWLKLFATERPEGQTSVEQPHLPIRCRTFTGAGDAPYEVRMTGRQMSIIGPYDPTGRPTTIEREQVSLSDTAWTPIMAVRRENVYPYALTSLIDLNVVASAAVKLAVVYNGTVDQPLNWEKPTDYTPTETLLQQNLNPQSVLDFTSGDLLFKETFAGGGKNDPGADGGPTFVTPLIETRPFLIFGRAAAGGTGSATANISATFREDY